MKIIEYPTALVVNDDPCQLHLITSLLRKKGLQVLASQRVEEAIQILNTQGPVHIIITELSLPDIDGWRFCRLLRSSEYAAFNKVPILVLSATFSGMDAEQITSDLRVNAFLPIPYDPIVFQAYVEDLLEGRKPQAALRVLIVEDSLTQAKGLQRVFRAHGYTVQIARTGTEGQRLCAEYHPHLLILDYHLPDMTGDQLLSWCKQMDTPPIVIMITTDPTPELALHFMRMGADGYVRKPFDSEYLITLCERTHRERLLLRVEDLLEERTKQLRESETRFRVLFDNIPEIVFVYDDHGVILYSNMVSKQVLEWEELVGKNIRDLRTTSPVLIGKELKKYPLGEGSYHFEATYFSQTGKRIEVEVNEQYIEFENKPAILSIGRDITARKQFIEALQVAKEYAENLINSSLDMIISVDLDRRIIEFNKAAQRTFGYRKEEVLGKPINILYGDSDQSTQVHQQALCTEKFTGEVLNRRKNGELFYSYLSSSVLRDVQGKVIGIMGISRDITEQKRMEAERQRLTIAVEQAAESIVITDTTGTICYVNPAFERVTGYAQAEALGQNFALLKEGEDYPFYQQIWNRLQKGEVWTGRLRPRRKDGTPYEEEATFSPVRNTSGQIVNYVAVLRDVTQEISLEAQLRQVQKLEAIGQLAGGIAHDFNNLLTGILGYANLLKLNAQLQDMVFHAADVIEKAAERGAQLTSQLLGFARQGKHQNVPVDLHSTIQEVIALLSRTVDKKIKFTQRLQAHGVFVQGDPAQLQQVIFNLALNARDAMPEGGEMSFATEVVTLDEAYCRHHMGATPGHYLLLSVTDTGVGIPKMIQDRIFEPFFTTKPSGKGTGMGLAMVYGIVKNHGGTIRVYSEEGQGTTFKVYLPITAPQSRIMEEKNPVTTPVPGRGKILIIDDEEGVREVLSDMLRHLGYEVVSVSDGVEALTYYQEKGHEIDAVILDMVMPRMKGKECFQKLRALNSRVKVILSSGYDRNEAVQEILDEGVQGFVQKPYRVQQLSEVIAKVLQEESLS